MSDFKKYQKSVETKRHTTSVNLTPAQKKFLDDNNINFSLFVRDRINEMMDSFNSTKKNLKKAV